MTIKKELISKLKHPNAPYWIFLLVFTVTNMFFLTSKFWLDNNKNQYYRTPLNIPVEALDRNITIVAWDYSATQNKMEVQLEIDNAAQSGIFNYSYVCYDRKLNMYPVTVIIEDPTYIVLQVDNIPKDFKELSLQMYLPNNPDNKAKLYTNNRDIDKVDSIMAVTLNEYYIKRIDKIILEYQQRQKEITDSIALEKSTINNNLASLSSYENQLPYVTSDKKIEIEAKINELQQNISYSNSTIAELQAEYDTIEDNIKKNQELKKQYIE